MGEWDRSPKAGIPPVTRPDTARYSAAVTPGGAGGPVTPFVPSTSSL
jgi:hypothetical protein